MIKTIEINLSYRVELSEFGAAFQSRSSDSRPWHTKLYLSAGHMDELCAEWQEMRATPDVLALEETK